MRMFHEMFYKYVLFMFAEKHNDNEYSETIGSDKAVFLLFCGKHKLKRCSCFVL